MKRPCKVAALKTLLALAAAVTVTACAPPLYVRNSPGAFPEVMAELQSAIAQNGYTLSRVQRVDYGLEKRGYHSDKYQVVFYGKAEEISRLGQNYPQLGPFLPLRITVHEVPGGVELVAVNPQRLARLYPEPELQETFARWRRDVVTILDQAANTR